MPLYLVTGAAGFIGCSIARALLTQGQRVRGVDQLMKSHLQRHSVCRDSILLNFPPAWVQHLSQPEV